MNIRVFSELVDGITTHCYEWKRENTCYPRVADDRFVLTKVTVCKGERGEYTCLLRVGWCHNYIAFRVKENTNYPGSASDKFAVT